MVRHDSDAGGSGPAEEIIRPMTANDLVAVVDLERAAQSTPWTTEHFAAELANPAARTDLCWRNGRLAGFLCWWLVAGEAQIQNVATAPAFRRQGVAARLLTHVLAECRRRGFESAWLEVRVSNAPAIALYERFGFVAVGRRRNYYADGEEALVMCYRPGKDFQLGEYAD